MCHLPRWSWERSMQILFLKIIIWVRWAVHHYRKTQLTIYHGLSPERKLVSEHCYFLAPKNKMHSHYEMFCKNKNRKTQEKAIFLRHSIYVCLSMIVAPDVESSAQWANPRSRFRRIFRPICCRFWESSTRLFPFSSMCFSLSLFWFLCNYFLFHKYTSEFYWIYVEHVCIWADHFLDTWWTLLKYMLNIYRVRFEHL